MKSFEIHKASLDNKFTGINTKVLGQAIGDLKYCGLKLYLYLASHPDNSNWLFQDRHHHLTFLTHYINPWYF